MSFYGSSFSFDGHSCEEFSLMLYDFNNTSQGNSKFASGMAIQEDRIAHRYRPLFYGTQWEDSLRFTLVFGADEYAAAQHEDIDRQEMEAISSWLTGHSDYKWLTINQPDMAGLRYRCIITDLEVVEFSGYKWAFQCTVNCDSPFGYTLPQTFSYSVDGSSSVLLQSRSSYNGFYYPKLILSLPNGGDFSITNISANGEKFQLTSTPTSVGQIEVNGESGVLQASSGANLYPYFNFIFPRLIRGDNKLTLSGKGTVTFTCEFPVNIGG